MSRLREALEPYSLKYPVNWFAYGLILWVLYLFAPASVHNAVEQHFRDQAEVADYNGTTGDYGN